MLFFMHIMPCFIHIAFFFLFFSFFFRKEIEFLYYAKSYHVTYISHSNAPDIIPEMFSERKKIYGIPSVAFDFHIGIEYADLNSNANFYG